MDSYYDRMIGEINACLDRLAKDDEPWIASWITTAICNDHAAGLREGDESHFWRWGTAHCVRDLVRKQINARAETVHGRRASRDAFKKRRCIVPADGFYEWTGPEAARQPLWFHRPDGGLLLFAGLSTHCSF